MFFVSCRFTTENHILQVLFILSWGYVLVNKQMWAVMGLLVLLPSFVAAQTQPAARHERRLAQQEVVVEYDEEIVEFSENKPSVSLDKRYLQLKKKLNNQLGLQYGVDISYTAQRGAPSGKQTSIQGYYYPYLTWNLFKDTAFGSGQLNVNYNLVRYWGVEGSTLQNRLGVLAAQNDYAANQEIFSQFSYTQTLPGEMDWLSVTVGQFPLYNFDGANYLDNQQTGLINFAMSQNASSTYANAGAGAYVQATPGKWTFAAGYQDATNILAETVRLHTAFDGKYTYFGYASFAPELKGLGQGQYSFLYYYQPSVKDQVGISRGYSFNINQNMSEKWVLSARVNWSDGHIANIKNSYVLAATLINPFERNANDAITVGVAYNRLDKTALGNLNGMRDYENAIEAQWVIGLGKLFTITPDIQFYPKAAVGDGHKFVTVAGLRAAVLL